MILWPNGSTTPPNFSAEGHFGYRNSSAPNASTFHRGLDMWGIGDVRSIAAGAVVLVGWGSQVGWGGGYQVWIQHDGFFSRTLHMVDGSARVRVGDRVIAGQPIGTEGATGAYQVHVHLEITLGQWHTANTGQIDPKAWLLAHVGGSAAAGGGSIETSTDTNDQEEEDMRLIRITDGNAKGRHYAIAPEYIKQIKTAEAVKAVEDAFGITERPISSWTLTRVLGAFGIPSGVLDSNGYVLDDLNGQGRHVSGGTWSRAQKVERLAYLAQKAHG